MRERPPQEMVRQLSLGITLTLTFLGLAVLAGTIFLETHVSDAGSATLSAYRWLIFGLCLAAICMLVLFFQPLVKRLGRLNAQLNAQNEALRQSEERFALAATGAADGLWDWDLQTNEVYFSPRFLALLEYAEGELPPVYASFESHLHPDDLARTQQAIQDHLVHQEPYNTEYRLQTKRGQYRWFQVRGQAVWDADRIPTRMVGSIRDITDRKQTEAALRESEARFRRAILEAPLPVMIHATDGEVLQLSRKWTELSGYSVSDLPTMEAWVTKAYGPRTNAMMEMIEAILQTADTQGLVQVGEFEITAKQGETRTWNFSTAAIGALADGRSLFVTMAIDISERKQTEDQIRVSEERLRLVTQATSDVLYDWNVETNTIWCNEGYERAFGLPQPLDKTFNADWWENHIHPEDRSRILAKRKAQLASKQETKWQIEYRMKCANGSYAHLLEIGTILRDEAGQPVRMVGALTDITERKRVEHRFQNLVNFAPDALVMVDGQGEIVLVNVQTESLFGYGREELLGQPIEILIPKRFHTAHMHHRATYTNAATVRRMGSGTEFYGQRKDGHEFPVEISLSPLETEGEMLIVSAIRDITERQQAERMLADAKEQAEAANRAKSAFLANMSHELRTPMNAIVGFSRMLLQRRSDALAARDCDAIETITRNADHLLTLITDLLDLSKIEAGKMDLSLSQCEVAEIVHETATQLTPLVKSKSLALTCVLSESACRLIADRAKLKQILLNLLSNAIKYTERGTITVTADQGTDPELGNVVRIAVRDAGEGISPEDQARLFERFTRLDTAGTKHAGGTGLGLAISDRLAHLHGGHIALESAVGMGSTFTLVLPLRPPEPTVAVAHADQPGTSRNETEQEELL